MYCCMEIQGHLDAGRLKQSVSLSGKMIPELLCAYDFKKGCFTNLGYTADDVVIYGQEPFGSLLKQDLACSPQLRILIERKEKQDLVTVVMSHILADGQGFLQYLYLLSLLYNDGRPDKNIQNIRDISPLLKNIGNPAAKEQTKHHKNISIPPLRPEKSGNSFFCLTSRIPAEIMAALHHKAKRHGATLNDVFMTAYARVIARMKNINALVLPCPADLRKFHPGMENALTVANMTGIYRKITVEIPPASTFAMTLQQVHIEIELQKSRYLCFEGIKALNKAFHRVPRALLGQAIKASYRLLPVSYTNVGIINDKKLFFRDCTISDCFFTGTYRTAPDFQLTVSTYKNVCTLNCMLLGTINDESSGQNILDQVRQEILGWVEGK